MAIFFRYLFLLLLERIPVCRWLFLCINYHRHFKKTSGGQMVYKYTDTIKKRPLYIYVNFTFMGKDSRFKLFWSENDKGTGGVGVLLAEEWWEKVFEVVRVSDRIILIRMTIGKTVFAFVCVYAPQANLSEFEKDRFYQMLQCAVSKIPASEQLIVCGDWNGHIGSQSTGFEEVHGGQAIGKRNTEGERILEFAFANELVVGNTWFKKKPEHLVTYQSGNAATQIDFILFRRSFRKQVSNVKVIPGEECASQHRLVVGDFRVSIPPQPKRKMCHASRCGS